MWPWMTKWIEEILMYDIFVHILKSFLSNFDLYIAVKSTTFINISVQDCG